MPHAPDVAMTGLSICHHRRATARRQSDRR